MILSKTLESFVLEEPVRSHAIRLIDRANTSGLATEVDDLAICTAAEYLGRRVDDLDIAPHEIAHRRGVEIGTLLQILPKFRELCAYRAYIGEWIRSDKAFPAAAIEEEPIESSDFARLGETLEPPQAIQSEPFKEESTAKRIWAQARKAMRVVPTQSRPRAVVPPKNNSSSSWTGSVGVRSYYNKDESPD